MENSNKNRQIKLRCHHLLCIQFFKGKGYSEQFVKNMQNIIDILKNNPKIEITDGEDDICKCCPNNKGICTSAKKVKGYDKKVSDFCQLKIGANYNYFDLKKLVYENILNKSLRTSVCGDCIWSEICHFNGEK